MTNISHTTQVLIIRHGNTFLPDEQPRRVGARTDLPLVEQDKAKAIGRYLARYFQPDLIFCSPLLRTKQTAAIALETAGLHSTPMQIDDRFVEIDYGPDENKIEPEVIARIGEAALQAWNEHAIAPAGWKINVDQLKQTWKAFFATMEKDHGDKKILVVTSNGIARFAPVILTQDTDQIQSLKMKTGHMSLFSLEANQAQGWQCLFWDKNPAIEKN